jgi:anti-sigma-K factor RskA
MPEDEHERYVPHLRSCSECQRDVAALQVVADALGLAAEQHVPPPALKDRIMTIVRSEAELLAASGPEADRPEPGERPRPWWRRPFLALRPLPAAIAAAVLIAVGVAGGIALTGGGDERIVAAQVKLASAPSAQASVQITDDATRLRVRDLPAPPRGKVYQVWLLRPSGTPEPGVLFRVDRAGEADVKIQDGRLKGVDQVLVTAEPDGGSQAPTSDPFISAATKS